MENKKYVPKKELTAFCVAGMGQGMIYALMSSYISDYYLNVLQLAPMFVLLLMLLARVWDAINDPLMGMIVDRSNLKSGKMIPFIRFALIPVAIIGSLVSVVGDIFASAIKRFYKIKDYGKIMPGHGGVLDRFDSMLFIAPLVELLMMWVPAVM